MSCVGMHTANYHLIVCSIQQPAELSSVQIHLAIQKWRCGVVELSRHQPESGHELGRDGIKLSS